MILVDEEGVEHRFYLHSILEVDGRDYALLEPVDGDGSLTVLRIEGDVETGNLVTLDDDEWERVAEALEEEDYVVLDDEEDDLDAFDDEDDDVEDDEDDEEEELDI